MKNVLHLNYPDLNNQIYCEYLRQVAVLDETHQKNYCAACPLFAGTIQNQGVECQYEDSTVKDGDMVTISSPWEFVEKRRKAIPMEDERRSRKFIVKK